MQVLAHSGDRQHADLPNPAHYISGNGRLAGGQNVLTASVGVVYLFSLHVCVNNHH